MWVNKCDRHYLPGQTAAHQVQAGEQGLTLVHFSAQLERFLWDRGCI